MCSLIKRRVAIALLLSSLSFPVYGKNLFTQVQLSSRVSETQGLPVIEQRSVTASQKNEQDLFIQMEPSRSLSVDLSVHRSQEDFANYILQNEDGTTRKLEPGEDHLSGQSGLRYQNGDWTAGLSHRRSLSSSPLAQSTTSLSLAKSFNHQLSNLEILHDRGLQRRPLTYYTDLLNGARRARPTEVGYDSTALAWEQVLSERMRVKVRGEVSEMTARPQALGFQVQSAFAFSSKDFLRVGYLQMREQDQLPLKDDRGYFSVQGYETKFSKYISYDWSIGAGYGLMIEKEDNPQNRRIQQMASDIWSLESDYKGSSWVVRMRYQQLVSNINFASQIFSGDMTWEF